MIYESTGSDTTTYTLGAGQLIAQTKNGVKDYFLRDGQHSTRALISPAAAMTQTFSYTPYGELINADGSLIQNPAPATRYLYTGQQFDSSTNLYSLRARYYDPSDGRFLTRDTWAYDYRNPVELNRYGYVAGNPVNWGDPSGYMAEKSALQKALAPARSAFRYAVSTFERDFVTGFGAGVIGWSIGKGIVWAIQSALRQPIADYTYPEDSPRLWGIASFTVDLIIAGLQGAFLALWNKRIEPMRGYSSDIRLERYQVAHITSTLWGLGQDLKNWVATMIPDRLSSTLWSLIDLGLDVAITLTVQNRLAGWVNMATYNLEDWGLLKKIPQKPLRSFASLFVMGVIDGIQGAAIDFTKKLVGPNPYDTPH